MRSIWRGIEDRSNFEAFDSNRSLKFKVETRPISEVSKILLSI